MLDATTARPVTRSGSVSGNGPHCGIPLGHLLATRLSESHTCEAKTQTTKQTGTPTAQDEVSDNDE